MFLIFLLMIGLSFTIIYFPLAPPVAYVLFIFNSRKNAIVQEIDITEREILVNYEDDSQEWISVDTRKIRFPPVE